MDKAPPKAGGASAFLDKAPPKADGSPTQAAAPLTPMMRQHSAMKQKYPGCILFFRLGDFYEMFFEDAVTASRELEITLTSRDCGQEERAPMCGVPYHAVDGYLARLVAKGYKVAICEQMEDPALAKGLVEREVVRVVTPGTVIEPSMLDEKSNAYLLCVYRAATAGHAAGHVAGQATGHAAGHAAAGMGSGMSGTSASADALFARDFAAVGLAATDLTTGALRATSMLWGNTNAKLIDEIAKYMPREIVANAAFFLDEGLAAQFSQRFAAMGSVISTSELPDERFDLAVARARVEAHAGPCGAKLDECSARATGALLSYLEETQRRGFGHIGGVEPYSVESYMMIDAATRRNLEITESMRARSRAGSLVGAIDRTVTSAGGRLLKSWLAQPLTDIPSIEARHRAVLELKNGYQARSRLRELLRGVQDMERLISRVAMGGAGCRDLLALRQSILRVPAARELADGCSAPFIIAARDKLDPLEDVSDLIGRAISEDAPPTPKDGNVIRSGYNGEVDSYRAASRDGKSWLAALEKREREDTGIKNLKVGYNRVFGYYIEISRQHTAQAPAHYVRRQTLANGERYISDELKRLEDEILGAEEKLLALEQRLYAEVRDAVAAQAARILRAAEGLAELDVIAAFAEAAHAEGYCMPTMNAGGVIDIKDGRHPVVERSLGRGRFVPNDAYLDLDARRMAVITGPNMAGKSTYMRQVALIALMAQAGSFVPASSADLCPVDRIFTRVGASDDLAAGQSTFMVEMGEVSHIIENATRNSLVVLDEIGRGTSTFDGLSIAWAVIEFISDVSKIGAKTLFSTHYHELTELSGKIPGVNNYCVAVADSGGEIRFLHKIEPGGADGSYGIHVAKLAGLPPAITDRAKDILGELEAADINRRASRVRRAPRGVEGQFNIFEAVDAPRQEREALDALRGMDLSEVTPLEALNRLYALQQKLKLG